jgi:hypothetical protein
MLTAIQRNKLFQIVSMVIDGIPIVKARQDVNVSNEEWLAIKTDAEAKPIISFVSKNKKHILNKIKERKVKEEVKKEPEFNTNLANIDDPDIELKKILLEAVYRNHGIVGLALRETGIEPDLHYNWLASDSDYYVKFKSSTFYLKDVSHMIMTRCLTSDSPYLKDKSGVPILDNEGRQVLDPNYLEARDRAALAVKIYEASKKEEEELHRFIMIENQKAGKDKPKAILDFANRPRPEGFDPEKWNEAIIEAEIISTPKKEVTHAIQASL